MGIFKMYLVFLIPKCADYKSSYSPWELYLFIHSYKYNRNKVDKVSKEHFKNETPNPVTLCLRLNLDFIFKISLDEVCKLSWLITCKVGLGQLIKYQLDITSMSIPMASHFHENSDHPFKMYTLRLALFLKIDISRNLPSLLKEIMDLQQIFVRLTQHCNNKYLI